MLVEITIVFEFIFHLIFKEEKERISGKIINWIFFHSKHADGPKGMINCVKTWAANYEKTIRVGGRDYHPAGLHQLIKHCGSMLLNSHRAPRKRI